MNHRAQLRQTSRSGQAIVEMAIGMIAIIVVLAAMIQLGRLGRAHTQTLMDARAEAGSFAVSDQYLLQGPGPQYIYNWSEGADGRRHSRDDTALYAMSYDVRNNILGHARPDDLTDAIGTNVLSDAYDTGNILGSFQMVHGRSKSEKIPLLPAVRDLFYNAENIQVEADVWLGWTREVP